MPTCDYCQSLPAVLKRPKTGDVICKACFLNRFEEEVHQVIIANRLFERGDRVAICASGGKDSTVLCEVLVKLNKRHDYGLDLFMLSIDEGISGYRDDSLSSVQSHQSIYGIELAIVSYAQLYGWSMDQIVSTIGRSNNCTFCGVFRRQAIDRGAIQMRADKVVTGHNADDMAETVLMNLLRGDIARLDRCTSITTGTSSPLPRCKPFKYCYEKEIVMYAFYAHLEYFSTECIYSPFAYRGFARELIKDCERVDPASIIDIIRAGEEMAIKGATAIKRTNAGKGEKSTCKRCGYMASNDICKACVMLEGLNAKREEMKLKQRGQGVVGLEMEESTDEHHDDDKQANAIVDPKTIQWSQAIDVTSEQQRQTVTKLFNAAAQKLNLPSANSPTGSSNKVVSTFASQNSTQW